MSPLSTSDAPKLTDKSVQRVYIKNGVRRMQTDTGWMHLTSDLAKRLFGKYRGGKYSYLQ